MKPTGDSDSSYGPSLTPEAFKAVIELWDQAEGTRYLPVVGGSMAPMLREGDQLRVERLSHARLGQIVVFLCSDSLFAHRVVRVEKDASGDDVLLTKGDRVLSPDPPLKSSELLGRVVAIRRGSTELSLETPTWGWIESVLGRLMHYQTGLWLAGIPEDGSAFSCVAPVRRNFCRAILLVGRTFIVKCLWIFGRWSG